MPGTQPDHREGRPIARIEAAAAGAPGLRAIELLCREGLTLRRLECRIELVGATPRMRRMLDAAGLSTVLPCADGPVEPDDPGGPSGLEAER